MNEDMVSVADILKDLDDSETKQFVTDASSRVPLRLPNSDWDESDHREMIDFPVSSTWQDYYHQRGMTPRHSPDYRGARPDYKSYHFKKQQDQQSHGVEM